MSRWEDFRHFGPSRPRAAKGGIRAQSQRGGFGESWWAKRWIQTLEGFDIGSRLRRGRSYARTGQVLAIAIEKGSISASVQGSRPQPYIIKIKVKSLAAGDWKKLAEVASSQAIFAAKLLAGEMPQEIENAFRDAGLSLFPEREDDLKTDCSCPDWSNPCKHIAAVYYLLGEEFDRDPFLIFKMRGMAREEFLGLMTAGRKSDATPEEEAEPAEPLTADPALFWTGKLKADNPPLKDVLHGTSAGNVAGAALVRRLGNFPFWRGSERFLDRLEPIYAAAAEKGIEMIGGG
ncbi:MAG: SWIM zinc finger family protein [Acidobacteriota bacterium]|nr:SWIM zinc finger family protein [Acidobacteriota bacterium]